MEATQIGNYLSPKKPSGDSKRSATLSVTEIAQFFARMEHLYGHRWTSQYGKALTTGNELTLSAKQWRYDLDGFTAIALSAALKTCETEYLDWPPTVPQFKALCREPAAAAIAGPSCDLCVLPAVRKSNGHSACEEHAKFYDQFYAARHEAVTKT